MRKIFLIAGLLLSAGFMSTGFAQDTSPTASEAAGSEKPLAVLVYADWCFNCKMILPRLAPLKEAFSDRIRFERLDVTTPETKAGAKEKARALGILKPYLANKGTGLVLLINSENEKVGELRYTQTDEEMSEKLEALAAG